MKNGKMSFKFIKKHAINMIESNIAFF